MSAMLRLPDNMPLLDSSFNYGPLTMCLGKKEHVNVQLTTWCHQFVEDTKFCMLRANYGPRMASVIIPALTRLARDEDIVVMNFGLWSNSLEELDMHTQLFKASFEYHRSQLPNRTFWKETTAQHYQTPSGQSFVLHSFPSQIVIFPG